MKIYLNAEVRRGGRSGVEARSPELKLTSHGADDDDALESLKRGIEAWCSGLQKLGQLEKALRDHKIKWEDIHEGISITLESKVLQSSR